VGGLTTYAQDLLQHKITGYGQFFVLDKYLRNNSLNTLIHVVLNFIARVDFPHFPGLA
jgi:hypothetical protein